MLQLLRYTIIEQGRRLEAYLMEEIKKPIKVGEIDKRVCELLGLSIEPGTPIFIGPTNIKHMKDSHPEDFIKYFGELKNILAEPDYLNQHPKDGSIQYIKMLEAHVMAVVRVSSKGTYFARSIYEMSENKLETYRKKKLLKKYR
jgi:hypothetical protein